MHDCEAELASSGDDLEGASNALLLAPAMDDREAERCAQQLSVAPEGDEAVLFVTFAESPDERLSAWREHADGRPSRIGFVAVRNSTRPTEEEATSSPDGRVSIRTVTTPRDLTGLGIEANGYLSAWADDEDRIVVCVHSLSTLLQYVGVQQAFRFLHVLAGRVEAVDGFAHYHMDPSAHDERTVNTLKALFDAVVELGDDGEWTVRAR